MGILHSCPQRYRSRIYRNVHGSIAPYAKECSAFLNAAGPANCHYLNVCKLSIGQVKIDIFPPGADDLTEGILAYDRAETNDGYMGQLNVVAASSFIGPGGCLWGYDLANNLEAREEWAFSKTTEWKTNYGGTSVYKIDCLLEAGQRLLGSGPLFNEYYVPEQCRQPYARDVQNIRFRIRPGEMTSAAVKSASTHQPGAIWSAIGVAIPQDEFADTEARLFYEDAGSFAGDQPEASAPEWYSQLERRMEAVAGTMVMNAKDQNILKFKEIYIGFVMQVVKKGYYAEAITLSPYIRLASDAVSRAGGVQKIIDMSISEWESAVVHAP